MHFFKFDTTLLEGLQTLQELTLTPQYLCVFTSISILPDTFF